MTHGRIFKAIMKQILYQRTCARKRFVVLDAPLLFESKILEHFCYPIVVIAVLDEELLLKRLMDRDQSSREDAERRIKAQMPLKTKV